MSATRLLLVDDSEAVLAFGRAALAGHYEISTATNGAEALELARRVRPSLVVLDLSMPVMSGDECLRRMKGDPELASIPVVIMSSEASRAAWCAEHGAAAFLHKPVAPPQLRESVARELERARQARLEGGLQVLPVSAGEVRFALPLAQVLRVLPEQETLPLALGPHYVRRYFVLDDEPLVVVDVAARLGLENARAPQDRVIAVVEEVGVRFALGADEVHDPEELAADAVFPAAESAPLGLERAILAMVRTSRGMLPVVSPGAFLSAGLLRRVAGVGPSLPRGGEG